MKTLFRLPRTETRREVEVEGVGNVVFEKSPRAGKINISVKSGGKVRVAIPGRISFRKAMEFFTLNIGWVKKSLGKIEISDSTKIRLEDEVDGERADEAKKIINTRVKELAEQHGFSYQRVTVRRQKTRWGSCSGSNNLSLNIKLVELPQELMDYVILHELVHTRVRNHSGEFWSTLDEYTDGRSREYRKKLAGYSLT